jgi:thiosulfate/3-mercaptopyruvate sulfurtransferase
LNAREQIAMGYENDQYVVQTDWLSDHLKDENVQILDCTVYLLATTDPKKHVYDTVSGREDYEQSHIPGAGFLDLVADFSEYDPQEVADYPFTVLSKAALSDRASRAGLDPSKHIVLYSNGRDAGALFAFRAWWVLRECGFKQVSILNGGFDKWLAEGYKTSQGPVHFPETQCQVDNGPGYFCAKEDVVEALGDSAAVVINSLPKDNFEGTSASHYGRPGRISGSVSVPMVSIFDQQGCIKPANELVEQFSSIGVIESSKVITYCGSGIAACVVGFALALLDYNEVSIYDRSLLEWANDPSLPMESGPAA